MSRNYARESGAFMAIAKMMRDEIGRLDSENPVYRELALVYLKALAKQTDKTLVEFGYEDV